MKKLALLFSLVPALALAQQPPPAGRAAAPGSDDATRMERMQKRMRLARTLGLAEALDLDEAAAMKLRDVMARFDGRRAPISKQVRDDLRILRDAAGGDKAAAAQVDPAIQRLRDARAQLQKLDAEMFGQVSQGLSPEKKARAALFLSRFHERAGRMMMMHHSGGRGQGMGPRHAGGDMPGGGFDPSGPGRAGPADPQQMMGQMMGPPGAADPDMEDWFADD